MVATGHMCLLNIWNMAKETKGLHLHFINLNLNNYL